MGPIPDGWDHMTVVIGRRALLAALGGAAAAWPLALNAQHGKIWRIGVLDTISAASNAANLDGLRQGLREHGYVEGRNIAFEYRSADGRNERFPELAKELVVLKVDLIVVRGTPATLAVKDATETIPVVMAAAGEPLMLVGGLARPGGNVTGLSSFVTELQAKRLELLRETVPGMARVAALLNLSNPVTPPQWAQIEAAGQLLAIKPRLFDVRERGDLERAITTAKAERADALIVGTGALIQDNRALIAELAQSHRLPTMHVSRDFVEAGGLIAYGPSYPDLYRRAATYVDRIFKGAKPGDLPIEQPVKFELAINLKTAKALGLTMPAKLLALADQVIE